MKRLKELAIQIETNRQRLKVALASQDQEAIFNTHRLITHAQAEFYETSRKHLGIKTDDCVLVVSREFEDGVVMDQATYRIYVSLLDHEGRETHVAVPCDAEMSTDVQEAVFAMLSKRTG